MTTLPDDAPARYDDLRAVYINCTLKPSPQSSHTQTLMDRSIAILEQVGVEVDVIRAVDHQLPPGVQVDMTEDGPFERDDWPGLLEQVLAADILVLGTPIWLGSPSSVCTQVVERLYAYSGELNDRGQYDFYGRVGGTIVTGNEDGIKHCAMTLLFALQHVGYTIPPQVDAGWIGPVGPGASYGDEPEDGGVPVGFDSNFTNRQTTIMTWNLLHLARLLKDAGGIPPFGNQPSRWADGERFGFPPPH
ncbi:MAG: flavodoxin family protein [Nitriliruptor sp.]|uniref:flavodoxin family protein n=1 Tax=Nitriliruptor sp. TaxID=2448056 RepID=UPI00349FDBD4